MNTDASVKSLQKASLVQVRRCVLEVRVGADEVLVQWKGISLMLADVIAVSAELQAGGH